MTFELLYEFPDESLVSKSELRFLSRGEIEERVIASGLHIDKLFGGWHFEGFDEGSSPEMIFFLRLPSH